MNDRDWYNLPEHKAKKFFKKSFYAVKTSIGAVRRFKERVESLKKAQTYHEAQRRAKAFKEWKYIQALELHRDKMKNFPELGLKLGDFIFEQRGKRLIEQEKELEKVKK